MGFFSKIRSGAENVKRAVCRGIGKAIEKVGEITHIIDIEVAGWDIQQKNQPVYEKKVDLNDSDTSVKETLDIHKMCEETRRDIERQAREIEDDLIDALKHDIDVFIDALTEDRFPNEILSMFNYEIEDDFLDNIHNTISDYVSDHISQDDETFIAILNMDDSVRSKETSIYMSRILDEAKELLRKKCRDKKIIVYRKMYDDIDEYLNNETILVNKTKENLEKLEENRNNVENSKRQVIMHIVDISRMECIRTLTYSNACRS